ncbi:MAG: WD40/YVTN/BNR-like repeat-containing protein [Saprospiraceae bacterium]
MTLTSFPCSTFTAQKKIVKYVLLTLIILPLALFAQKNKEKESQKFTYPEALYDAIQYRPIGPYRGGRSCAVAGVPNKPNLYYFGATGGGVWRTKDGGRHWNNISDGFFGGSVGALAVSESDPNVIYVGGGEVTVRGNVSSGYGLWKSVDAGKTWTASGLEKSRHIARIRVHPKDHNIVYTAAMGNLYKPNEERGIFKSTDGGKTWKKVLFVNDEVGAVDLCFDPNNPRILFASTWRIKRTPYSLSSGGDGSALWYSTDAGETWENISENKGLPKGTLGIIGVTVSPVNSDRVWAIIEAEEGGVFRSDDGGKTWAKTNDERKLRQRAWYYSRIYADTQDEDKVYVMNVRYHQSKDGGKSFKSFGTPHGDHHDLWIAPEDNSRIVVADDGGAQITYDGSETWTTYYNQPTAQFYRVTTDNHFPFRIYAAQQDNSTIRLQHRSSGGSLNEAHWESTAGCECGHIAIDPTNDEIVYGGCYDGYLGRKNHGTDQSQTISVWPDNPMGHGAEGMRYRFNWNFPVFFSPHQNNKLYTASNHLHVSYDQGKSWEIISPDLTRNDSSKLVSSGGPITKDNTSVEYYCTIFAAVESPRVRDIIWTGSDDGLIHLTRDGGKNWENVTPKKLPEWAQINSIEADPFNDGGLYVTATKYKLGDFTPYLFYTNDFGKSWRRIDKGIDREHFTRVVRADPVRKNMLYAGTETGMYLSFNNGEDWQPFQLNLPIVPITDLTIKENKLIVATQGRSLWMIDDLSPLRQLNEEISNKSFHLYKPAPTYRMDGYQAKKTNNAGKNHPAGVMSYFYLKDDPDTTTVSLSFHDSDGKLIRSFSTKAKEKKEKLKVKKGANYFTWNMQYEDLEKFEGMILWWASMDGPKAVPGDYQAKLKLGDEETTVPFTILKDPRSESTQADLQAQFDFVQSVGTKVSEAHESIKNIRKVRKQLDHYRERLKDKEDYKDLIEMADQIDSTMTLVEEALYQTKNKSAQDPLNFPIRLTNKLAHLNSLTRGGNYPPTAQAIAVKNELTGLIDQELEKLQVILNQDIPKFNQLMREKQVDAIILE